MSEKLKKVMLLLRDIMSIISIIIAIILIILITLVCILPGTLLVTFVRMRNWLYNEDNDNNPVNTN